MENTSTLSYSKRQQISNVNSGDKIFPHCVKRRGGYQQKQGFQCANVDKWKTVINIYTCMKNGASNLFSVEKGVENRNLSTSYSQIVDKISDGGHLCFQNVDDFWPTRCCR